MGCPPVACVRSWGSRGTYGGQQLLPLKQVNRVDAGVSNQQAYSYGEYR